MSGKGIQAILLSMRFRQVDEQPDLDAHVHGRHTQDRGDRTNIPRVGLILLCVVVAWRMENWGSGSGWGISLLRGHDIRVSSEPATIAGYARWCG